MLGCMCHLVLPDKLSIGNVLLIACSLQALCLRNRPVSRWSDASVVIGSGLLYMCTGACTHTHSLTHTHIAICPTCLLCIYHTCAVSILQLVKTSLLKIFCVGNGTYLAVITPFHVKWCGKVVNLTRN